MNRITTILIVLLSASCLGADPNLIKLVVDKLGMTEVEAINFLTPPNPVEIPFVGQWLDQPTRKVSDSNAILIEDWPDSLIWVYDANDWRPKQTKSHKKYVIVRTVEPVVLPSCDVNGDGIVNFVEFAYWAKKWTGQ